MVYRARSVEETMKALDEELRHLHQSCLGAGHTPQKIAEFAAPVLRLADRGRNRRNAARGVGMLVAVLSVLALVRMDWTWLLVSAYGRSAFIHVLPLWDWTQMYHKDCLISNPNYVYRKLQNDDCLICESLDIMSRLTNATHEDISENYIKCDIPVIVEDGLRDWNVSNGAFSFHKLAKIFLDSDPYGDIYPCTFSSNLRLRGEQYFHTLLHKLEDEDMSTKRWYAHWENCGKASSKTLRRWHPRPYFLPPMVDTSEPTWVLASSNYRGRVFKEVVPVSDMLWLAQAHGSITIKLRPRSPCNETCVEITDTLEEGQALIYTDRMWHFEYLPGEDPVNVAIGGGGMFEL